MEAVFSDSAGLNPTAFLYSRSIVSSGVVSAVSSRRGSCIVCGDDLTEVSHGLLLLMLKALISAIEDRLLLVAVLRSRSPLAEASLKAELRFRPLPVFG